MDATPRTTTTTSTTKSSGRSGQLRHRAGTVVVMFCLALAAIAGTTVVSAGPASAEKVSDETRLANTCASLRLKVESTTKLWNDAVVWNRTKGHLSTWLLTSIYNDMRTAKDNYNATCAAKYGPIY